LHIAEYTNGIDISIPAPIRKICKRDVEDVIVFKKGTRRSSNYDDFKHKQKRILKDQIARENNAKIDVYSEIDCLDVIAERIEQNFYVTMEIFRLDLEQLFI